MARKNVTKARADQLLEAIGVARRESGEEGAKSASAESVLELAFAYAAPVVTAFDKAGLDIEELGDWLKLAILLSGAVYGNRVGAHKTWSSEDYEILLGDIADLRRLYPRDAEQELCAKLLKKMKKNKEAAKCHRISKSSTLRRQLQNAKKWKEIRAGLAALAKRGKGPMDLLRAQRKLNKVRSNKIQPAA